MAQVTSKLVIGTGVTCPSFRIHPTIIAQAAATAATSLAGRFFLGVGTGENLNEHILGQGWPEIEIRQEKLVEALQIIRMLWKAGQHSHRGKHFTVENARIYSLPEHPPRIMIAAAGSRSAQIAAELGDGLIATEPSRQLIQQFRGAAGDKPVTENCTFVSMTTNVKRASWPTRFGQLRVCPGSSFPSCRCPRFSKKRPSS